MIKINSEEYLKEKLDEGEQRIKECDFEPTTVTIDIEHIREYGDLRAKEERKHCDTEWMRASVRKASDYAKEFREIVKKETAKEIFDELERRYLAESQNNPYILKIHIKWLETLKKKWCE